KLVGVLERWARLQSVPCRAFQSELAIDQLELGNRHCDVVFGQSGKTAGIDDGVCNGLVSANDDVLDRSNPLLVVVEHRLAQDLPLGTPAEGDVTQFAVADAKECRSGYLRMRGSWG